MRRETIAFFDVDHTIIRGASTVPFIVECVRRGIVKPWYLLAAPVLFVLYRAFSVSMDALYKRSLPRLRGISRADLEEVGRVAYRRALRGTVYPGARREIDALRKEGVRVILATSAPFEAVYPLALDLGVSAAEIVSTQFAYDREGRFDGKLVGVPVFSRNKCSIIRDYASRAGIDLQSCSFYTDSVHDLPLLELVGRPVAANPDGRLARVARRRGWTVKDFAS
ncbi:MAG TPA: HAD-IB family hydrolase [Treponemataceae bacterium]|jgi:HAD superfamily hydrolase (TIGR01490 family)|nr:HAD-IB family hydrolase [Treponemataceae bacterium]